MEGILLGEFPVPQTFDDGIQTPLSGKEGEFLRNQWNIGMDYHPYIPAFSYLSNWLKVIFSGDYDEFMKMLEGKKESKIKMMISRRETLMNVSAIFHVINGARLFSSDDQKFKHLQNTAKQNLKVKNEHKKIFLKLLSLGCDINIRDVAGFTPLHHCCSAFATEETLKMAELLIWKRADINAKSRFGSTALHEATNVFRYDVIQFLLKYGADPYIVDYEGDSARKIAGQSSNPKLMEIFSKFDREKVRQERKEKGNPWKCEFCGKEDKSNKKCKGCYHVWYCNSECQVQHRNEHKETCEVIR